MSDPTPQSAPPARRHVHHSMLFRLAVFLTVVGAAMWIYSAVTSTSHAASAPPTPGAAGLVESAAPQPTPEPRLIDDSAPATFRFGLSFSVGFFLAWLARQFLKLTLLATGGLATLGIVLSKYNLLPFEWGNVQTHLEHALAFARGEFDHFRSFITGYLPSAGSAIAGGFFGFRHK